MKVVPCCRASSQKTAVKGETETRSLWVIVVPNISLCMAVTCSQRSGIFCDHVITNYCWPWWKKWIWTSLRIGKVTRESSDTETPSLLRLWTTAYKMKSINSNKHFVANSAKQCSLYLTDSTITAHALIILDNNSVTHQVPVTQTTCTCTSQKLSSFVNPFNSHPFCM